MRMYQVGQRMTISKSVKYWIIFASSLILLLSWWSCSTKNLIGTERTGSIFVNSNPTGAFIIVDGTFTGKITPDTVFNVSVGDRIVWVSLSGYLVSPESVVVAVSENQLSMAEFVLLETSYGSLKVSSNVEGAIICIDQQPTTEITPHVFFNSVPVGTHIISIFKEGHSNESPAKEVANITTGDTVEVNFTLNSATVGKATGNIPPDFELEDDYGFWHRLYAYRGFVTIINFWGTTCDGCMKELPYLEEIYQDYLSDSLIIFGINYENDLDLIRQVRKDKELTFIVLVAAETSIKSDYEIAGTPVTIFLDRAGKIYYYHRSFNPSSAPGIFRQKLDELFGI